MEKDKLSKRITEPIPPITGKDAEAFVEQLFRELTPEEKEQRRKIFEKALEVFNRHGPPQIIRSDDNASENSPNTDSDR